MTCSSHCLKCGMFYPNQLLWECKACGSRQIDRDIETDYSKKENNKTEDNESEWGDDSECI